MQIIKRSKAKRVGTSSAKITLSCFTLTWHFLEEIWPKILNCKNGLAGRIMILYGQRDSISLDETAEYADNLDESPIKNLNHLYERIYTEHNPTQLAKKTFYCSHKTRSVRKWGQILQKHFEDCNGITCSLASYWQLITIRNLTLPLPRLVVASWIWQYPWLTASQTSRELVKQ